VSGTAAAITDYNEARPVEEVRDFYLSVTNVVL
jgi:hypothetical protein